MPNRPHAHWRAPGLTMLLPITVALTSIALTSLAAEVVPRSALAQAPATPAAPAHAAAPSESPVIAARWIPARLVPGSLVELELELPAGARHPAVEIAGTAAGEPLHFEPAAPGRWRALVGIPIDAPDTLAVPLVVRGATDAFDSVVVHAAVSRAAYPLERLTVPPRFGTRPDSALQTRIDSEYARAVSVSRQAHATPRLWRAPFTRPRPSRVTSTYGRGREFNGVVQSRHMGVDFAGATGAPVHASNRGVVALVGDTFLGGNVVYIDHGAGVVTGYLHLSRVDVAEGDTVRRGQVIGRVGSTGRATGPHLHWVARYGQVTVNPLDLLRLRHESATTRRTPPPRPAEH